MKQKKQEPAFEVRTIYVEHGGRYYSCLCQIAVELETAVERAEYWGTQCACGRGDFERVKLLDFTAKCCGEQVEDETILGELETIVKEEIGETK